MGGYRGTLRPPQTECAQLVSQSSELVVQPSQGTRAAPTLTLEACKSAPGGAAGSEWCPHSLGDRKGGNREQNGEQKASQTQAQLTKFMACPQKKGKTEG